MSNYLADTIRNSAKAAHAQYPQYAGHWDGPEWILVEVTRTVKTKLGAAFVKGDISLGKVETEGPMAGSWTIYSVSNKVDTGVPAKAARAF